MHKIVSKDYPKGGCDFYIIRHAALSRLLSTNPKGSSSIIPMLEVCQGLTFIPYERKKREIGKSGYTLSKKIFVFISFFISNTYFPLRVMSVAGFLFSAIAFIYAAVTTISSLIYTGGVSVPGWTTIVVFITFFSGLILASLGVIGEYLWRIFDCVRDKPLYHVLYTPEDIEQEE